MRTTTVSHPGHSYTDCSGDTSYFGSFHDYGSSGSVSGTATTSTHCSTTFSPPTEETLTTYKRVNYTIVRSQQAVYLLACTQTWKPSRKSIFLGALAGGVAGAAGAQTRNSGTSGQGGKWSECPAFTVGSRHALTVHGASDAEFDGTAGTKLGKLDYLGAAALPMANPKSEPPAQTGAANATAASKIHITSIPSRAEIYVDGKFFGNTPSDITLTLGEHVVKVTLGAKEWSRTVQITAGEISIHAELPQ